MRRLFLGLLVGCGPVTSTETLTDVGTACVNASGDVEVSFPGCLSSSCDTLTSATCTAELVDGVLVVHAEAVIVHEGDICTDDCGFIGASCPMPLVEDPDSVVLSYGGTETPLDAECSGY